MGMLVLSTKNRTHGENHHDMHVYARLVSFFSGLPLACSEEERGDEERYAVVSRGSKYGTDWKILASAPNATGEDGLTLDGAH